MDRLAADGMSHVHLVAADITDRDALKEAAQVVNGILQKAGLVGLDILVNNAAYMSESTGLTTLAD